MGVLGELGRRLQTDIADLARASADPVFARQQAEARFKREDRELIREADMKKIARQEQFNRESAEIKRKATVQTKLVEDALAAGRAPGGDFSVLFNLTQNEELMPEIRQHAIFAYESGFGESFDAGLKKQQLKNETRRIENSEANTLLRKGELISVKKRSQQKLLLQQAEFDYEKGQQIIQEGQDKTNTQALIDSIQSTVGVFSDKEKKSIILGMTGTSSKQAFGVYKLIWNRYSDKLNGIRKRQESIDKPVTISKADVDLAGFELKSSVEEYDSMDDEDQFAFSQTVASKARHLARDRGVDVSRTIPEAIQLSRRGIIKGKESWLWDFGLFDNDPTFSVSLIEETQQPDSIQSKKDALQVGDIWIVGDQRMRYNGGDKDSAKSYTTTIGFRG